MEEHDIDQFDDRSSSHFLTRSDYHNAKMVNYQETYTFEKGSFMPEIYQEMQHKSYGFISGIKKEAKSKKNARNVPAKQGIPLDHKHAIHEGRDKVAYTKEIRRYVVGFSLEHAINKIKIPILLTELIKNQ